MVTAAHGIYVSAFVLLGSTSCVLAAKTMATRLAQHVLHSPDVLADAPEAFVKEDREYVTFDPSKLHQRNAPPGTFQGSARRFVRFANKIGAGDTWTCSWNYIPNLMTMSLLSDGSETRPKDGLTSIPIDTRGAQHPSQLLPGWNFVRISYAIDWVGRLQVVAGGKTAWMETRSYYFVPQGSPKHPLIQTINITGGKAQFFFSYGNLTDQYLDVPEYYRARYGVIYEMDLPDPDAKYVPALSSDYGIGPGTCVFGQAVQASLQECTASATTRDSGSWARWPSAPGHKLNDNEFIFVTHVGQNVHMALVDRENQSRGSRFNGDQTIDVWNQTQVVQAWNTGTDWYINYMGDLTNIGINCPA